MSHSFVKWLVFVGGLITSLAAANDPHGRFLSGVGKNTKIGQYGNPTPTEVDQFIMDTVKGFVAGLVRFDLDSWVGPPSGPYTRGGAALSGGFFMAQGVTLKPDFRLHWVQTVEASTAGANAWNLGNMNAGPFPDVIDRSQKHYPHEFVSFGNQPTLGFQDYPSRTMRNPANETWTGELALVCVNDIPDAQGYREVRVVRSFEWSFSINIDHAAPFGISDVTLGPENPWSAPSQELLDTLTDYYDGTAEAGNPDKPSGKFHFSDNSNCFVELPSFPNGLCDAGSGETPCNAQVDCPGPCPHCGDLFCQAGENTCSCPLDCLGSCPGCGDRTCGPGETECNCPVDCTTVYSSTDIDCATAAPTSSTVGLAILAVLVCVAGGRLIQHRSHAT